MKLRTYFLLLVLLPVYSKAQDLTEIQLKHQVSIRKATDKIVIDGRIDELSWSEADVAKNIYRKYPTAHELAYRQMEIRMTYDDKFIYVSAICMDSSYYVVQTLKRDSRFFEGDGFAIMLDPLNRKTNGFFFGVSPLNVQSEDLLTGSGFGNMNFSWDNKWFSEVTRHEDRWIVEMAIPFKTLRYESEKTTWGVNFVRNDIKRNEYHSWTDMPANFRYTDLGWIGTLNWDQPPPKAGTNISIIPYVSGSSSIDREDDPAKRKNEINGGFDAKVALSSALNLDLTVNPDFSQVDVDVQQTNLTRFSLNFPERRPFFLENNDLFANYGTPPARPIFTRAIGLDEDANPIPILYGARLSGSVGPYSRIGLLNLQTQTDAEGLAQNYSIATFNQSILKRSVVKGYGTNRQAYSATEGFMDDYGRNAGIEFNYRNESGSWSSWSAIHGSDKTGQGEGYFKNIGLRYNGDNFRYFADYLDVDTNYSTDMGFIPRLENHDALLDTTINLGFKWLFQNVNYTVRKEQGKIAQYRFGTNMTTIFNPDRSLNERRNNIYYSINFRNTSEFGTWFNNNDNRLPFNTEFTDGLPLPPDTYRFNQGGFRYSSDKRKLLAWEMGATLGEFYNGTIRTYRAGFTYRRQPWGSFDVSAERNEIDFPDPYGDENFLLINQRTEINFSNQLFWTTFFQYNTQDNNININSRLQWRYSPMSDLFLVYSDNYFNDPLFKNKSRALIFKWNYWLTL